MRHKLVFLFLLLMIVPFLMATGSCSHPTPSPTPSPEPTATPTPDPSPSPTPTPTPAESCNFGLSDVSSYKLVVKPNGGQTLDVTFYACGTVPPCNHPDPRLARCCDLSVDHGNGACATALVGEPWWSPDASLQLDSLPPGVGTGGYTHKVSSGDGFISICGSVSMNSKPGACARFHAFKGAPACDMNADPSLGCVLQ
jgi:hypothetical protein